jgi:opacity protein-like surface antigen
MRARSILLTAFLALSIATSAGAADTAATDANPHTVASVFDQSEEESVAEILRHNDSVTDAEIAAWHEFMLEHNEAELLAWRNQLPSERSAFVANQRKAHNEARVRLSTLRTLSAKERADLEEMLAIVGPHSARINPLRELMAAMDEDAHRVIFAEGIKLATRFADRAAVRARGSDNLRQSDVPSSLDFIAPDLIRCSRDACSIFLHKGVGAGLGYAVELDPDRGWLLYTFDHYRSWERTEIVLDPKP